MTVSSRRPSQPSPPLWKQFSNFTNNSPSGLEKLLRLLQALAQIVSEVSMLSSPGLAGRCAVAKTQLALARRYFRFFKFIDSFEHAFAALSLSLSSSSSNDPASASGSSSGGNDSRPGFIWRSVEVAKWTCLGLYFLLEDLTILDAMGIWSTPWSHDIFLSANQFWFYALMLSLIGSIWTLISPVPEQQQQQQQKKKGSQPSAEKTEKMQSSRTTPLLKRIVVDGCDLLIPGSCVGWIGASPTQVGVAMVVSTVVAAQDIWITAQGQSRKENKNTFYSAGSEP